MLLIGKLSIVKMLVLCWATDSMPSQSKSQQAFFEGWGWNWQTDSKIYTGIQRT